MNNLELLLENQNVKKMLVLLLSPEESVVFRASSFNQCTGWHNDIYVDSKYVHGISLRVSLSRFLSTADSLKDSDWANFPLARDWKGGIITELVNIGIKGFYRTEL
jgi:hypothetical protein